MFDLHVHSAPCLFPRRADDVTTVRWYEEAGCTGLVLKSHFEPTAGRAAAAGAGTRIEVYGSLVLNSHCGGLNPAAVEIALGLGARVIWMPTFDARAGQHPALRRPHEDAPLFAVPPVDETTEQACLRIFELIAEADAVLATGHLSTAEVGWLVPAAKRAGVTRILLTHPSFLVPAMTAAETRELLELGTWAEITAWQLLHQEGCSAAVLASFVRETDPARIVLSTDSGQPNTPPGPEALAMLVAALVAEGLDPTAVEAMASEIPRRLVAPA
ncbi:MAG TPA: DUF6282 family protein [Gaiellaceae bacterium]|nr:DUF6282 family protein [Gaiellaceae bacterium]